MDSVVLSDILQESVKNRIAFDVDFVQLAVAPVMVAYIDKFAKQELVARLQRNRE